MPSHKKIVPKKRQSLHVWKQKETKENSTRKSDDVSQKTHCFLCNEGLIEVHPVGNSETTVIHGCTICQFRYLGIKDGELVPMYQLTSRVKLDLQPKSAAQWNVAFCPMFVMTSLGGIGSGLGRSTQSVKYLSFYKLIHAYRCVSNTAANV